EGSWLEAAAFVMRAGRIPGVGRRSLARAVGALTLSPSIERAAKRVLRRPGAIDWIDHNWFRQRGVAPVSALRPQSREARKELLGHTIEHVHLQALLRYEDRNAMAVSLENRVPFLTAGLARFAMSLPESFLIDRAGERKAVFRKAVHGLVPDAILDRREKF